MRMVFDYKVQILRYKNLVSGSAFDVVGNYYPVDIPLQYRCWLYNDEINRTKQVPHVIHGQGFPNFFATFCLLSVCGAP